MRATAGHGRFCIPNVWSCGLASDIDAIVSRLENWGRSARAADPIHVGKGGEAPARISPVYDEWSPSNGWEEGWGDPVPSPAPIPIDEEDADRLDRVLVLNGALSRAHLAAIKNTYWRKWRKSRVNPDVLLIAILRVKWELER